VQKTDRKGAGWLIFFYTVPSRPVSNRMKVWRRLNKAGAVQLKGAVYILPFNDEHYELLQWLVTEIAEMRGEGAFARIENIDTMKDSEVIALFNRQRADDYAIAGKALDDLERRLGSIRKGAKAQNIKEISEQFNRIRRDFDDIQRVDFFSSQEGVSLSERIRRAQAALKTLPGVNDTKETPAPIAQRKAGDYQGKVWVTRKRPFIDRMASAWLIKRFIDRDAVFDFVDEMDLDKIDKGAVPFDIRGGEFTHAGDLCTFEVLIRAFGPRDKTLKRISEIVHDLDMKDEKYKATEAKGIEDILSGIRKTAKDDRDALEKGMAVFEMIYASKSR